MCTCNCFKLQRFEGFKFADDRQRNSENWYVLVVFQTETNRNGNNNTFIKTELFVFSPLCLILCGR